MASRIEITAGGAPSGQQLAALSAAATAVVEAVAPHDGGGGPEAYRSRWRRAAMLEMTDAPVNAKDNGIAWGGTA